MSLLACCTFAIGFDCVLCFPQTHGQRAAWEDPSDWILETYPFQRSADGERPSLLKVRAEDVGYDVTAHLQNGEQSGQRSRAQSDADTDPLVSVGPSQHQHSCAKCLRETFCFS